MTDVEDPLRTFDDLAQCPSCAALAAKGTPRCPECGDFHMPIEDADDRIPEERRRRAEPVPSKPINPEFYSVDPHGDIPEEVFEADEDAVTDWKDAHMDFGLEDDE